MRKVTHFVIRGHNGELTEAHASPAAMAAAVTSRLEDARAKIAEGGWSAAGLEFAIVPVIADVDEPKGGGS